MKASLVIKVVCLLTAVTVMPALFATVAEARPSTKSYTCQGVRNLISRHGAIVMNTKNSRVYRRFVRNSRYCHIGFYLDYYSAPTKTGSCRLRYCSRHGPLEDLFDRRD